MPKSHRAAQVAGVLPLVTAWLVGCGGSDAPSAPTTQPPSATAVRLAACEGPALSLPAALAATLPSVEPTDRAYTIDDRMAALARRAPGGFAGVFYDQGRPVLLLTDPAQAAAAKLALAPELANFPVADAEARPARWDYAQLNDWYRYVRRQGLSVAASGVVSTDLDEAANRLHFGVLDAATRDRLAARLTELGVPCDLVLVSLQSPPILL